MDYKFITNLRDFRIISPFFFAKVAGTLRTVMQETGVPGVQKQLKRRCGPRTITAAYFEEAKRLPPGACRRYCAGSGNVSVKDDCLEGRQRRGYLASGNCVALACHVVGIGSVGKGDGHLDFLPAVAEIDD